MSAQWWLVGPLVLLAALYAAWRLAPQALRTRLRTALGLRPPAGDAGACDHCRTHKH